MLARVTALAEPPDRGEQEYTQGLRLAVGAAVRYAIEGIAHSERDGSTIPESLLGQARRAARSGIGLDTVLRRYVAGHALISDFLVQEAEGRITPAELKRALRRLGWTLDVLLAAVTTAYGLEERRHRRTGEQRRDELVECLLEGEPLDASELDYELGLWHLGLVASGAGAREAATALARSLSARLLTLPRADGEIWAWLGRIEPFDPDAAVRCAAATRPPEALLAFGEPAEGPGGWRLTHRQAAAAVPVARHGEQAIVRYRDVVLLSAVMQDDLLATSLRRLFLEPLAAERDGGQALRETARAYLAAGRNVSSAAVALGVDRRTVSSRLRAAEAHIGNSLDACVSELQMALQLDELDRRPS